jgi:hypothetical protein
MRAIHIISEMSSDSPETRRRHRVAAETWRELYQNGVVPCHISMTELPRNSRDIGDSRELPFIKDLIEYGIEKHRPEVVVITNADICLAKDAAKRVSDVLNTSDACYSHRMNFDGPLEDPIPDAQISQGTEEIYGVDFFAFKVDWWNRVKKIFPDMLLGCERWDILLMNLIIITCPPSCILSNLTYHEKHHAFWCDGVNRFANIGQKHNLSVSEGIHEKLQLLGYIRRISCYPDKTSLNYAIEYEVNSLDTTKGLFETFLT